MENENDLVLGVDASASSLYLALKGKGISIDRSFVSIRNTDTMLLDEIVNILKYANVSFDDLSYVALGEGPGSFTSLRIAASTLKGLTFSKGLRIKSVPTLEALFHSYQRCTDSSIVPLIDARMHRFYAAIYKNGECILNRGDLSIEGIIERVSGNIIFTYHPLEKENIKQLLGTDFLQSHNDKISLAEVCLIKNPSLSLIELSYNREFDNASKGPIYVREHSGLIK